MRTLPSPLSCPFLREERERKWSEIRRRLLDTVSSFAQRAFLIRKDKGVLYIRPLLPKGGMPFLQNAVSSLHGAGFMLRY